MADMAGKGEVKEIVTFGMTGEPCPDENSS
jgi:hypothetical protein